MNTKGFTTFSSPRISSHDCGSHERGFALIEILLSISVFVLIVTGLIGAVIYGQDSTRLAGARNRAVALAEEGLEAVRNIRDENFNNITNGTYYLSTSGNQWSLVTSPVDTTDIFTRQITIADLSPSDPNKKNVTSTVTWTQNQQRSGTVTLNSRLTFWQKVVSTLGSALIVYGDGTTTPKNRTYDRAANTFGTENPTVSGTAALATQVRTSPTKQEAIAGYLNSSGNLQVMCFDGNSWNNDWSVTVGGNGGNKRFDIAYETQSGDVIVVYSTDAAGSAELRYRTKAGTLGCGASNWVPDPSGLGTVLESPGTGTTDQVKWVKMAWDKRSSSNIIAALWLDSNQDLWAAMWDGDTFSGNIKPTALETSVEAITGTDVDPFDVEFESLSGEVMAVWGWSGGTNGTNGAFYATCTPAGANCTWSARAGIFSGSADDATHLDLSANPDTNQMIFASIGNAGGDLQAAYWPGSTPWTTHPNIETSCQSPTIQSKFIATGWLINGGQTRYIIVYHDSNERDIGWFVGNPGSTPAGQTDFAPTPIFANAPQKWYDIQMDPVNQEQLIFTISDSANDLFAKRLTMNSSGTFTSPDGWSNADEGVALETNAGVSANPFSFAYWRQ